MDTKELFDWASDAGLNFEDSDPSDAVSVWAEQILNDPEWLTDLWLDALADQFYTLAGDNTDEGKEMKEGRERVLKHIGKFARDLDFLPACRTSERLMSCYATSVAYSAIQVGEAVGLAVKAYVEKYVEENAQEWWGDVCAYHHDMMAGQYEDYQYEQWKDRQLEDRE